jgi:type IV secretion system protein VirD4
LLGKETIDTNTYGKSSGRSGNYSTNYQISGRELLTPDEVRMLDNRYAILFIRGERPIMDFKYDLLKHPNVNKTNDGKEKAYFHGNTDKAIATVVFDENIEQYKDFTKIEEIASNYEIISSEDIEEYLRKEEKDEKE